MQIELTEEQRNNILGLIARTPKLPNESSFEFAKIITGIEAALLSPMPAMPNPELGKAKLVPMDNTLANPAPGNGQP